MKRGIPLKCLCPISEASWTTRFAHGWVAKLWGAEEPEERLIRFLILVDIVQPDACTSGGLLECQRIAALAAAHHVRVAPHAWGTDSPRKDVVSDTESTRAQIENRLKTISGRSIFGDCLRRKTTRAAISSGTILT